jgi:peptidoglycan biosynthesis protein MviN/MurJ (putative lipid II flippase)
MIALALGNGLLPAATERHRGHDRNALVHLSKLTLRLGILISLAAMAYLVICRDEMIRVVLQRGALQEDPAHDTADLVGLLALALPGLSAIAIASKGLFAVGEQRRVAQLSTITFLAYVPVALALRNTYGTKGLALAFALASFVGGALLTSLFARTLGLHLREVIREWVLGPSIHAATFALGAYAGWAVSPHQSGVIGASAALAAALVSGAAAVTVAIAVADGPERRVITDRLGPRTRSALRL